MASKNERVLHALLTEVRDCRVCEAHLPHGPRPVVQAGAAAKLLIVGQAPGRRVHDTGIPWNDPSGDRLRTWMNVERDVFYDEQRIAIVPAGLCYPGKGKSGDLPPRVECAPMWHQPLLAAMPKVQLTLLVGRYAQELFLKENCKATLTETVAAWEQYLPRFLPLPHPSPRNQSWWKYNRWFERELLPVLRERVQSILSS